MIRRFIIFIIYLLFATVIGTDFSRAISGEDIIPISTDKEKRMGDSIAKRVEEKFDEVDDPLIQKRFEEIGKKLAAVCDRQDLIYRFKVLKAKNNKEKYYNAFALPGGYVYIFDALMEKMETDDKIAAVTAHELGHISRRHSVERLRSSLGVNVLMILAMAATRDGKTIAKTNEALLQLMMSYSREDEFEADRLSVKYLEKAGFDTNGILESLLTLQGLRKKGREMRYAFYKSHPYLSERIAACRAEIKGYTDFDSYINLPEEKEDF
ncbi:MAG: M48 family metalloprotease [Candidatus Omnitrophota bacterium]|nr:MAG: M48 family metalloprotease [Candidatus Omnitrophota bacterium]